MQFLAEKRFSYELFPIIINPAGFPEFDCDIGYPALAHKTVLLMKLYRSCVYIGDDGNYIRYAVIRGKLLQSREQNFADVLMWLLST